MVLTDQEQVTLFLLCSVINKVMEDLTHLTLAMTAMTMANGNHVGCNINNDSDNVLLTPCMSTKLLW